MQKQISIHSWLAENTTDCVYTPILLAVCGRSLSGIAGMAEGVGGCGLCDDR